MSQSERIQKRAIALVAEIDEIELAARFAEIATGLKRPPGQSAAQVMKDAERGAKEMQEPDAEYAVACWHRMAREAVRYFRECIEAGQAPS